MIVNMFLLHINSAGSKSRQKLHVDGTIYYITFISLILMYVLCCIPVIDCTDINISAMVLNFICESYLQQKIIISVSVSVILSMCTVLHDILLFIECIK